MAMATDPLLSLHRRPSDLMVGVVDYLGRPASRSATGGWTSALFIIVVEIAERLAFFGLSSNLIIYLTGPLNEPTATAAAAISTWTGVACMLPLLGAVVADSYLGRHRTVVVASLLYILGLGTLTLSSALPSFFRPANCGGAMDPVACTPPPAQVALFYASLYLVALAQGGHKPSVQAFAADQFDQADPKESIARSAFFNWWCFALYCGILLGFVVVSYAQDNLGWVLGFGIPCMVMLFGLLVFLLGTRTYRFHLQEEESPFAHIAKAFLALARTRAEADTERHRSDVGDVEDAKRLLRLFPTWATCLIYAAVINQPPTLFTKQASTLDRSISSNFRVPPAALLTLSSASAAAFILIYDRLLVPAARRFTGRPSGITMLQRIGVGMAISLISIVVAALMETKKLRTARESGLVDQPEATIPMSIWWLVPQYVLTGVADSFSLTGLQEFFYDQVPDALRSLGVALYLSILGAGHFIDGFMVSAVNKITGGMGESWFSNNLNRAHLDYFYWLLAGLGVLELVLYLRFAQAYVYKKKVEEDRHCTRVS